VFGEDGGIDVARAVADNLHRLMAYKDEYEVARLLTCPAFVRRVGEAFTGPVRIHYNLQPPLMRNLGLRRKVRAGPWTRPLLASLAGLRFLRGTWLDPFRFQAIRRRERALISWYSGLVELCLDRLRPGTVELVVELLSVPQAIRGYEHVKAESIDLAMRRAEELVEVLFGDRLPGGRRERRDATVAI
jgi:indolepyruvate ferredoxin oxidoreductase